MCAAVFFGRVVYGGVGGQVYLYPCREAPLTLSTRDKKMIDFIQRNTDVILYLMSVALFTIGYWYGHMVGHSRGFKAGRAAARRHPSLRNEKI